VLRRTQEAHQGLFVGSALFSAVFAISALWSLGSVPTPAILMRGASDERQQRSLQPLERSVEAFAGIDPLDLDDPTWLLPQPSD
jgi:hypothetical protein